MSEQGELRFDVVVVGGGPVGLAMALALVRSLCGVKVAILDRRPFTVPKDLRAYALAAGVRRALEQLGVWDQIVDFAEPVLRMEITDSGNGDISRPHFLTFDGEVAPGEAFAHLVPNTRVTGALTDALQGEVTFIAPVEVTAYTAERALGRLGLADGRSIAAPLIIAADGAQSSLRRMAGIDVIAHDYRQSGIVTTIEHELPHHGTAWEHFRPAGPFASLPLPGNRSSLVWTETTAEAARIKGLSPEGAASEIEAAMGATLGTVTLVDAIQAFPLRLQLAKSVVAPRLALIGDAAHVVHPISGQGLNLGLKDVAALAEVVVETLRLGLDPGGQETLARYQRWRRMDTALMAAVTDGMNRLFSNDIAPVRALRDFGLGLVDRTAPVKDFLISRAAGIDRNGPRLLNGRPI
jgi:2-octaprenyl-6-methoxyphenol hydroxylase